MVPYQKCEALQRIETHLCDEKNIPAMRTIVLASEDWVDGLFWGQELSPKEEAVTLPSLPPLILQGEPFLTVSSSCLFVSLFLLLLIVQVISFHSS